MFDSDWCRLAVCGWWWTRLTFARCFLSLLSMSASGVGTLGFVNPNVAKASSWWPFVEAFAWLRIPPPLVKAMQRIVQTTAVFRTKFGAYGSVGFRPQESGYTGQFCDQKTHGHTVCLKIRIDMNRHIMHIYTQIYIYIYLYTHIYTHAQKTTTRTLVSALCRLCRVCSSSPSLRGWLQELYINKTTRFPCTFPIGSPGNNTFTYM